ncbi:methyltransferase domain-containing protein [Nonomuraea sp. NPDC003709]|uniref:methyltransferase domain-containing protein n=1 Tax=Nonomuraea sp. NPDC003709 TaxID=3154450 RepID=UPI0033B00F2A
MPPRRPSVHCEPISAAATRSLSSAYARGRSSWNWAPRAASKVLIAAGRVGPLGTAYGLDSNMEMVELSRRNAAAAGVTNAEFLHGSIEAIPLPDEAVDAVISTCVSNTAHDRLGVLRDAFRVLRPGGHLVLVDVVTARPLDATQRAAIEQRTICVAGALSIAAYHAALTAIGFAGGAITLTAQHGDDVRSAIVQATKPNLSTSPPSGLRPGNVG